MTVRCSTCGTTKFGLIRQRHYFLVFCSRRCKARYLDRLAQDTERIESWQRWLYGCRNREPQKDQAGSL